MNAKVLKLVVFVVIMSSAPAAAWADPNLFGFTNTHEVVSLITNQGTFLTSTSPFNPGTNNSGWWSATLFNITTNDNYLVGVLGGVPNDFFLNDFFTFFIPSAVGTITSASLSAPRGGDGGGASTTGVPFTYFLFDVNTPAAILNANTGTSAAIFNDLGSGVSYGSILVSNLFTPDPLVITLNASAIAAINSSRGEFFTIGGTLTPIPEPSSLLLLGLGLGLGIVRGCRISGRKNIEDPRTRWKCRL